MTTIIHRGWKIQKHFVKGFEGINLHDCDEEVIIGETVEEVKYWIDDYEGEKMTYKIKRGELYECIKDFIMFDETIAFVKDKVYLSENDKCLTNETGDKFHGMEKVVDFFESFKKIN